MLKFNRRNFFKMNKVLTCKDIIYILNKNVLKHQILDNFEILDISSLTTQKIIQFYFR